MTQINCTVKIHIWMLKSQAHEVCAPNNHIHSNEPHVICHTSYCQIKTLQNILAFWGMHLGAFSALNAAVNISKCFSDTVQSRLENKTN